MNRTDMSFEFVRRIWRLPCLCSVVFCLWSGAGVNAEDWSQFRGPNSQGVSGETGLPLEWSATKNIAWKTPLPGPGASSPITYRDRVYVTCYSELCFGSPSRSGCVPAEPYPRREK